jgi:hypothetical protein
MRNNNEYQLCKQVSNYLRLKYPKVIFHFDLAGLNLSRAQAGMTKAIQGGRGWPDLFIAEPRGNCSGLFIELKAEGTKLLKLNHEFTTPHIEEQHDMIMKLRIKKYMADFCIGFDSARMLIDAYMNIKS